MDGFQTISGRRTHRSSYPGKDPEFKYAAQQKRTETIIANRDRCVSIGANEYLCTGAIYGICVAVCVEVVSEYVAEHVSGFVEGGGEDEEGVADAH